MNQEKPGKMYEWVVAGIYRDFSKTAKITENEVVIGKSGRPRQIDISLRIDVAGHEVLIVIECKDQTRRVDIGQVDELIGKIEDVGAAKGILSSDCGFSSGAKERAKQDGRIELISVIDTQNLKLRSQIYLPVQVAIHEILPQIECTFEIERFPSHPIVQLKISEKEKDLLFEKELAGLGKKYTKELFKQLDGLISTEAGSIAAGPNSFSRVLVEDTHFKLIGKCDFIMAIRTFIKKDLFMDGKGIYNQISQKIIAGNKLGNIRINPNEIKTSWREVPNKYVLKRCRTFFRVIYRLPIDKLP